MNRTPLILIVDDEPLNVELLEQELDDLGYETISASNGQEALDRIAADNPDLVLLDIMMPVMDGFDVLQTMQADDTMQHIPVIVISALSDIDHVIQGIELGAADHLPKPFDPVLLEARVSTSVERKLLRDQEQAYLRAMTRELEIGKQIQGEFLPGALPDVTGWRLEKFFQSARDVAGDFYDAFWLPDGNRFVAVLGDVCDKGVGAALYMTLFRSLLRVNAQHSSDGPSEMIARYIVVATNDYVATVHEPSTMFATLFLAVIDPTSGELAYVNAGHEPPMLFDGSGIREEIQRTGPVTGLFSNMEYRTGSMTLAPGEGLLVYSDGITDAEDESGAFFGRDALRVSLNNGITMTPNTVLNSVTDAVLDFVGLAAQTDDLTMLLVQHM